MPTESQRHRTSTVVFSIVLPYGLPRGPRPLLLRVVRPCSEKRHSGPPIQASPIQALAFCAVYRFVPEVGYEFKRSAASMLFPNPQLKGRQFRSFVVLNALSKRRKAATNDNVPTSPNGTALLIPDAPPGAPTLPLSLVERERR